MAVCGRAYSSACKLGSESCGSVGTEAAASLCGLRGTPGLAIGQDTPTQVNQVCTSLWQQQLGHKWPLT